MNRRSKEVSEVRKLAKQGIACGDSRHHIYCKNNSLNLGATSMSKCKIGTQF